MGTRVLVDSNIIIDVWNGVTQARQLIASHDDIAFSAITWIEVLTGVSSEKEVDARRFLTTMQIVHVDNAIMEETVRLRRMSRLKLADATILATAHVQNRVLLTRNTKDFSPGPSVLIPYIL